MKVICIDGLKKGEPIRYSIKGNDYPITPEEEIYEGEKYIVIAEVEHESQLWYQLEGKPTDICYRSTRFAPISEIDETEFERNYQKELA